MGLQDKGLELGMYVMHLEGEFGQDIDDGGGVSLGLLQSELFTDCTRFPLNLGTPLFICGSPY